MAKRYHVSASWIIFLVTLLFTVVCVSSFAELAPGLVLNEASVTLVKGRNVKLTPTASNVTNPRNLKYTWESSNPSVAAVTNGNVKAVDGGSAVITCSTVLEDGTSIKATATVTVTVPVASLKLASSNQVTLKAGSTQRVMVSIAPANATNKTLIWKSSDSSIATVDKEGIITAKSAGRAKVTAETNDGTKKKVQLSVYVPSLYSTVSSVNVNSIDGKSVDFYYYGKSWSTDVTINQKGNSFTYSVSRDGAKRSIKFMPVSAGSGSLTISDKKDPQSRFSINVNVTSTAIPPYQYLLFTNVRLNNGNISASFKNNSGTEIAEYQFVVIPYNKFNEQWFYEREVGKEPRYYFLSQSIKAGHTGSLNGWFGKDYPDSNIDHIDIAVNYIRLFDGSVFSFANSNLYWFSSKTNSYKSLPRNKEIKKDPSQAELDKADSFRLGWEQVELSEWIASHFGYHYGGYYVTKVPRDTIADKMGLREKDLVVAVDGIKAVDDLYFIERGKAKMADGETISIQIERYGQKGLIELWANLDMEKTTLANNESPVQEAVNPPEEKPTAEDNLVYSDTNMDIKYMDVYTKSDKDEITMYVDLIVENKQDTMYRFVCDSISVNGYTFSMGSQATEIPSKTKYMLEMQADGRMYSKLGIQKVENFGMVFGYYPAKEGEQDNYDKIQTEPVEIK